MKKVKYLIGLMCLLCFSFVLSGCFSKDEETYKLTFISEEGKEYYNFETAGNEIITLPSNPTKVGYDFKGWYLDKEYKISVDKNHFKDKALEKDTNVYAKWELTSYTITYELDGGINNNANPSEYNITTPTITLLNPTKTGYNFLGWCKEATFENEVESIELGSTGNLTLHAKWEAISYTITYELDGGVNDNANPAGYTIATSTITLANPAKKGYNFLGWYKEATYENEVTTIEAESMKNITLYAKWEKVDYTITYELDGGVNDKGNPVGYYITSPHFTLRNPTKTGYNFLGWYMEATYETKIDTIYKGTTGNLTLYAKWEATNYQIKYVLDGGVNHPDNPTYRNIENDTIILKEPTREGYRFLGWYKDLNDVVMVTEIYPGINSITLYAKWERVYTITYHLDGGVNHPDNPTEYKNIDSYIVIKEPTRKGANFDGWYENPEFTHEFTGVILEGEERDVVLYAKWRLIRYSLSYDANGGTFSVDNVTYDVEYERNLSDLGEPTRKGYTFLGWYTTDTDVKVEKIEKGTTGDISLIAKWEIINYTITYHLDGGVNHPDNPIQFNVEDLPITIQTPTKEGYSLFCWSETGTSCDPYPTATITYLANIEYYAVWNIVTYKVNFDANGGTVHLDQISFTINYDDIEFDDLGENITPYKDGYEFLGWYTTDTDVKVEKIEKGTTGDINLIAKWQIINYTITYHLDGGTNSPDNPTEYNVNSETITLQAPTREGYTFEGWYSNSNYGFCYTTISKGSTGNKVLYAKWI